MIKIWKFGPRPGLWKHIDENKYDKGKRFVYDYALEFDYVAIGNAWVKGDFNVLIHDNKLKKVMNEGWEEYKTEEKGKKLEFREREFFRRIVKIKVGDIILQYLDVKGSDTGMVFVGKAIMGKNGKTPYYYSPDNIIKNTDGFNNAPHRVKVTWDFKDNDMEFKKEKSFPARFNGVFLGRRIVQVDEQILKKTILDSKLKNYLRYKLKE